MNPQNPDPNQVPEDMPPSAAAAPVGPSVPAESLQPAQPAGPPAAAGQGQVISGGFDPSASSLPSAAPASAGMPPAPTGMGSAPGQTGVVVGAPDVAAAGMPASPPPTSRRSLKPFLIALAAVLVIGIGSVAAYVGIVVPNKPANVLKAAFINTLQQQQVSSTGSAALTSGVFKTTFSTASNASAKAVDAQMNFTYSGVSLPVEVRYVNKNFYFKVGDLSSIASLLDTISPDTGSLAKALNTQVANKWIVVDSTIIDQNSTLKCELNTDWSLSKNDIKLVEDQYNKYPFATVKSTSSDTVNGKSAEKFTVNMSDDDGAKFIKGLNSLSLIKSANACDKSGKTTLSLPADHKTTPLTIWVDKSSKLIVKVGSSSADFGGGFSSSSSGSSTSDTKGNIAVTLSYKPVNISAPANAEPVLQLFAALENATGGNADLSQLFSNGGIQTPGTL